MDEKVLKIAITTLTCNDRNTLRGSIRAFMANTCFLSEKKKIEIEWYILLQGCTSAYITLFITFIKESFICECLEYESKITEKKRKFHCKQKNEIKSNFCKFHLLIVDQNLGLSKGNNLLCEQTCSYRYVLNIEDDWLLLPFAITRCPSTWLWSALQFMELHTDVSTIFLRKYATEKEKWQYGWTRSISYNNHKYAQQNFNWKQKMCGSERIVQDGLVFAHIPHFLFTFNPAIRRNEDYYKACIFPLNEFEDINHRRQAWAQTKEDTITRWGWCEAFAMEFHRNLKTFTLQSGSFGHFEDWVPHLNNIFIT